MPEPSHQGLKPPYMAFQTFWNFIEGLSGHPLPPLIDRSLMGSKSGTDQANLISTLKTLGLINDQQSVRPALTALVYAEGDHRSTLLADLLQEHYAEALEVSASNGTSTQLEQCFRDNYAVVSAVTLRKSITFFLHAARAAGVPISPHFKQTRGGQGAPGQPRKRTAKRKSRNGIAAPSSATAPPSPQVDAYRLSVNLQTGGTMTLAVNVNPISLRGEDRAFFYDIVDKMADYDQAEVVEASYPDEGDPMDEA